MGIQFNFFRVLFDRLMTISSIFPLDGHKTGEIPPVAWKQKAAINGAAESTSKSTPTTWAICFTNLATLST